jgi:hypothetical protein
MYWIIIAGILILFLLKPIFSVLLKILLIKFFITVITFKQWLNKTVTKLDENVYLLEHNINNQIVKIIVHRKKIDSVVDENYENCFLDESLPYLLYQQIPFNPTMIGLSKETKLLINQKPLFQDEDAPKLKGQKIGAASPPTLNSEESETD